MTPGICCSNQRRTGDFLALSAASMSVRSLGSLDETFATIAKYPIDTRPGCSFCLNISIGSVVDFDYPFCPEKSAIVNAANEACLGGGGVDGAVTTAGGPNLAKDRSELPVITTEGYHRVRCPTGEAVITGPNSYGSLNVSYVIHAVGPNYSTIEGNLKVGDDLLKAAYTSSLERAKEAKIEAVAFSLISSGNYSGRRSKKEVLEIGIKAIRGFDGYEELNDVHLCAFSDEDAATLVEVATRLGLKENRPNKGGKFSLKNQFLSFMSNISRLSRPSTKSKPSFSWGRSFQTNTFASEHSSVHPFEEGNEESFLIDEDILKPRDIDSKK